MTRFEAAVLTILAHAAVPLGWYQIERRLSSMVLTERPHLLTVIAELSRRGLVREIRTSDKPTVRYALTPAGTNAIDAIK